MYLHQLLSVATYEAKVLRRGWMFRTFAFIALCFILTFQIITQSSLTYSFQWDMMALACTMPFVCCYLLNMAQGMILIFSTDTFLDKKKTDTNDVFLVRSMSNGEYVIGKLLGLFKTIILFDLIIFSLAALLNLFLSESPFNFFIYLFYFVTLLLPSLIFILGFCAFISYGIRQHALVLFILLGFFAFTSFYTTRFYYGAFDFLGNTLPNGFSDITGHGHLTLYLLQRLSVCLLGIGLSAFAVSMYKRLPNQPGKPTSYRIAGGIFILLFMACLTGYLSLYSQRNTIRQTYFATYKKYVSEPRATLTAHDITLKQEGKTISVNSKITIVNENTTLLSHIIFYLNPGLVISSLKDDSGVPVPFDREHQVIRVAQSLEPQDSQTFHIVYNGGIDENICYSELSPEDYYATNDFNHFFNYGNKYAFIEKHFTLLTPEALWYPVTCPTINPISAFEVMKNFTDYTLHVIPPSDQLVVSQGDQTVSGDTIIFTNKQPLHALSLCIGEFSQKNIRIDSTLEVSLFHFKRENISSFRLGLTDEEIVSYFNNQFRVSAPFLGNRYPFNRLRIIETPITFTSHPRRWKDNSEFIQPELLLVPEKGAPFPEFNFTCQRQKFNKDIAGIQTFSQEEKARIGGEGSKNFLFQMSINRFFNQEISFQQKNRFFSSFLKKEDVITKNNPWYIFSMQHNFTNYFYAENFPIINHIFKNMFYRIYTGNMGKNVEDFNALKYLADHSLEQTIHDTEISDIMLNAIVRLKATALKDIINILIPAHDFETFLAEFIQKYQFKQTDIKEFEKELENRYNIKISPIIEKWYKSKQIARFNIGNPKIYEIQDNEFNRYQVCLPIHNASDADGVISLLAIAYRTRSDGQLNKQNRLPNFYLVKANSYNEIKIMTTASPIMIILKTGTSLNIPTDQTIPLHTLPREQGNSMEEGIFDATPTLFDSDPNEIIVDDADPGFRIINPKSQGIIQRLFKNETRHSLSEYEFGKQWEIKYNTEYYGKYIKQARFKLVGFSEEKVEWKTNIQKAGTYEVFIYNPAVLRLDLQSGKPKLKIRNYTVSHADGEDNIDLEITDIGWFSLGKFRLNKGEATVVLHDKAKEASDVIAADAVKWVINPN